MSARSAALDLPDLGAQQPVDGFETFGPLLLGQALSLQVRADAGECRRAPRVPGHDIGAAALAWSGVGHADQGHLGNGGVPRGQELHPFGVIFSPPRSMRSLMRPSIE
jgi:hypothetical protein